MKYKKKIIFLIIVALVLILGISINIINNKLEWKIAEEAIAEGGYTCPAGINYPIPLHCFTTGDPPVCTGPGEAEALCATIVDIDRCVLYSAEQGTNAGGCNTNIALLSEPAIEEAGINPSGGLIAGCWSPAQCDNGPVAGPGGCYNCFAKADWKEKIQKKAEYLFKYVIAGFKK